MQEYVPPTVEDLGSVEELTLGRSFGLNLDADWTVGKRVSDIPYS